MVEPITPKFVDVQDEAPDPAVQLQATRDGVAVVLLNRPRRGNAIGSPEVQALAEAFDTLQGAEGVRVVERPAPAVTVTEPGDASADAW